MGTGTGMVRTLVRIALLSAILTVSQVALAFIPNCELVSLLLAVITVVFGREAYAVATVFALTELAIYGPGLWVLNYLYVWHVLVFIIMRVRNVRVGRDFYVGIVLTLYGLLFGALCSLVYLPFGLGTALAWWMSGVVFDLMHGFWNCVLWILVGRILLRTIKIASR